MSRGKTLLGTLALLVALALPAAAQANSPAWAVQSVANPTNFKAGNETGFDRYYVYLTNSGGAPTQREGEAEDPILITDALPAGLSVKSVQLFTPRRPTDIAPTACPSTPPGATTVSCEVAELAASVSPVSPGVQMLGFQVAIPGIRSSSGMNRIN